MERLISSPEEMKGIVTDLLAFAGRRTKFALTGEIGAGKTTLVQAFCRHLNTVDQVTSPTFSIVNEYLYKDPGSGRDRMFYHIDLYRLEDLEEALAIGIEEYLDRPDYCFIEWPEIIEPLLPEDIVRINIQIEADSKRKILFL